MAGILKVDQVQSDSNLAFAIAGSNVAFMNATSLQMVGSNVSLAGTNVITNGKLVRAAQPVGAVLQVVQTYSDIVFNTSSSTDVATGVIVNITPISSSSKILIMMTGVCGSGFATNFGRGRIARSIAGGDYSGVGAEFFLGGIMAATVGNRTTEEWSHDFLDSPNTTSQVAYQLFMSVKDGSSMWIGRWGQDGNWLQSTSITVMEIAG